MSTKTFGRYAPFIQEYIYRKKWENLRDVQVAACDAIMDTENHIIIASGTASGKTEAAFFPILSRLYYDPADSIGVIYIGPLKALINDQFTRLEELLEEADIPLWPWHGEVSQSMKKKALTKARGVVQITPESLEALMMHHSKEIERLFCDLRFVVIDEIHALMGQDRGSQVMCLIERLEKMAGCRPRRIGLSATLNNYETAVDFIRGKDTREGTAVTLEGLGRKLSLCVESFEETEEDDEPYKEFIYDNSHRKKCLIFTNSRHGAEKTIDTMKAIAKEKGEPDIFYVHHGSVSAVLRKELEARLRDKTEPVVATATLTLELGIDIGDLDSTLQIGAPYSCASFVQRLGRSGRRSGKSEMLFVNTFSSAVIDSPDAMPWDLLRTIAIIELYLRERWVEPFKEKRKPFSLLAHQTLAVLTAETELSPAKLAAKVLTLSPFADNISSEEYKTLLRYMIEKDYLAKMDDGKLIVGLKGEKITGHYSFYAVFKDEETYKVFAEGKEIGSLHGNLSEGSGFVLAGRWWQVVTVDEEKKRIFAASGLPSRVQTWKGNAGAIHSRIVMQMKKILQEDKVYSYLQPTAADILNEARRFAREAGILDNVVLKDQGGGIYIWPWAGTTVMDTLEKLLTNELRETLKVKSVSNGQYYLYVNSNLNRTEFCKKIKGFKFDKLDPLCVLPEGQAPRIDKYDYMVPPDLRRTAFLYNQMEMESVEALIAT